GVRPGAARARRRRRRERSLPRRHARERPALRPAGLPRRPARRLREHEGAPARHGRRRSGRLHADEAEHLRGRARRLAAGALPARRARTRDVEPDLRQRPLRPDPVPRSADDLRRAGARRAAAPRDDRALRRPAGARRDALRLRRVGRADRARAGGRAGRGVGGGGRTRLRRARRHRGLSRPRDRPQARRPGRGRLQRHVAAGADVRQLHRPRREDDRRRRVQVPVRSARAVHVGDDALRRPRRPGGLVRERAAARRRGLRVLGAEPDDDLGDPARARAGARAARDRRRSRGRRHPQRERHAPRRHAVGLGGPVRRRDRPVRREPPRRRGQPDALVPGERDRAGRGGDRVGRAGRRPPARDRPGHGRRRLQPRRERALPRHALAPAGGAPPDVAAVQTAERLRRRGRRRRPHGRDLDLPARRRRVRRAAPHGRGLVLRGHAGRRAARPRDERPLAGGPLPLSVPRPFLAHGADVGSPLPEQRRRRLRRPVRPRAGARAPRCPRRLRLDRRRGSRLRRRRSRRPGRGSRGTRRRRGRDRRAARWPVTAVPTRREIVGRATALRPLLVEQQAETEARTYYSEEIHRAFLEAGFYRMLVPRRYGGYELDLPTVLHVVIELARGCMSSAWCLCLAMGHALQVGALYEERAQDELFADADFRCPAVAAPAGAATRVDGGWELNSTHAYSSGAPYATYYMGQTFVADSGGDGRPPTILLFVAPRDQWTMLDDWGDTLGLKGSGSHSVRFEGARIPEHFVLENTWMVDTDVSRGTPGLRLHGNPMYAGRTLSFFQAELAALMVGGLKGAVDEYEGLVTTR